jgi:hypothetical protein
LKHAGWALVVVILVAIGWGYAFYFRQSAPPFEDAAMLLRYADHVAQGHGIVWNVGEAPVDGATDFLYMLMVAGFVKLGLPTENAASLLNLLAHALTVLLVFHIHMRRAQAAVWAAALSAIVIATGPGLSYWAAGFGTTVFALAGLVTFSYFMPFLEGDARPGAATGFALAGIVTALIRPEGVILVGGMAMSLCWYLRGNERKVLIQRFLLLFVLPGLLYFGWHWWYFGFPLPNPFYVKGGGLLYPSSLKISFIAVVQMGGVLLPIFAWAAWKKDARRKTMLLGGPLVLFGLAWILLSGAMNFYFRFQYILMPLMWVAWPPVVAWMRPGWRLQGRWLLLALPMVAMMVVYYFLQFAQHPHTHADGRADLGRALQAWEGRGYTLATTEAGNLPLYSHWPTIDTWGLNDSHIAHQGTIDRAYFEAARPALVMVHDFWSPGIAKLRPEEKWAVMTDSLTAYLGSDAYALVACWGRHPESTHFYYLRRDLPDFVSLKGLIQGFDYRWYEDGALAENFLGMVE